MSGSKKCLHGKIKVELDSLMIVGVGELVYELLILAIYWGDRVEVENLAKPEGEATICSSWLRLRAANLMPVTFSYSMNLLLLLIDILL